MSERPLSPDRAKRLICYSTAVLVALSMNMINLGAVFYLRDHRSATGSQIGLFSAMFWLGYSGGCHLLQPRLRHWSAARAVQASLAAMSLIVLLYVFVPWLPLLFLLALCKGLALSLFWPIVMGWITAGMEGRDLNRELARFNLAWSSGMIVGPYIAGWLSDFDSTFTILVGSALYVVGAAFLIVIGELQPEVRLTVSGGTPQDRGTDTVDRSTPLRFPAWLGLFATFAALGVIINVFPLAAREELGMMPSTVGVLFLQRSLLSTLTFLVLGQVIFWHFRLWPMLVSMVTLALLHVALIGMESLSVLVVLFGAMGILMSLCYNASLFHGAAGSPDRTARMAMHESIIGGGIVLGSIGGGWLYQYHGTVAVYATTAAALLAAAGAQLWLYYLLLSRRQSVG